MQRLAALLVIGVLLALSAGCGGGQDQPVTPFGPDDRGTTTATTATAPVTTAATTGTVPEPVPEPEPEPPESDEATFRAQADQICRATLEQGFMMRAYSPGSSADVIQLFWSDQQRQLPYWNAALDQMAALGPPSDLAAGWAAYVQAGRDLAGLIADGLGQVQAGADPGAVFTTILPGVIGYVRQAQASAMELQLMECFKLYYGGRLSPTYTTPEDELP